MDTHVNPRLFKILRLFIFLQLDENLFRRIEESFLTDSSGVMNLVKSALSSVLDLSEIKEDNFNHPIVKKRIEEVISELKKIFGEDYENIKKVLYSINIKNLPSREQQIVKLFKKYG